MNDFNLFDQARTALVLASASESDPQRRAHWLDLAQCFKARSLAARRAARTVPEVKVNGDRLTIDGKRYRCDQLQPQRLGFIAALLKYRELGFAGIGSTDAVRNTTRRFAKWADGIGQHGIADACKRAAFSGDIASIE